MGVTKKRSKLVFHNTGQRLEHVLPKDPPWLQGKHHFVPVVLAIHICSYCNPYWQHLHCANDRTYDLCLTSASHYYQNKLYVSMWISLGTNIEIENWVLVDRLKTNSRWYMHNSECGSNKECSGTVSMFKTWAIHSEKKQSQVKWGVFSETEDKIVQ